MPAHAKALLLGCSLTIPITDGNLNLGTWQGIYLDEHRNYGGSRKIVVTITGIQLLKKRIIMNFKHLFIDFFKL